MNELLIILSGSVNSNIFIMSVLWDYKITQFWIKHLEFTTTLHLGAMEDGFTERIKETNHIFSQLIMAS